MRDTTALFARYLDLAPLKGRDHGLVRCIFHPDHDPSLSVDLEAGVFKCFGCGAQGGLREFSQRVGEPWRGPDRTYLAPLDEEYTIMRRFALMRAERDLLNAQARLAPAGLVNDVYRHETRCIAQMRVEASDPDDEQTWERLAEAAAVETVIEALAVTGETRERRPIV